MRRFLVVEEAVCQECGGDGYVENHLWEDFWERYGESIQEAEKRGPGEGLRAFREAAEAFWGPDGPEPEEYVCGNCEGEGIVRREVDLVYALAEIGFRKEDGGKDA